jgi:adenosylmethionine-8-amino-7-oxononanoate aminotransferase
MGHPTAAAAALAVQRKIASANLLDNVRKQGDLLDSLLHERLGNHANIGDIRGRGLFRGIELVADRASKEPLDPKLKLHARIKSHAMDRCLICYPDGGTADGVRGDHVMLAPPFIINEAQIRELVEILGDAIDAALAEAC